MKCTKEKCDKQAEYVVDGQSVCKDHGPNQEEQGQSMADQMVGRF